MASGEVYNLQWSDYQATLSKSIGCLLDDSDFIDVTLACEGQSFSAHKLVLSSCSGYLKKLLKRNPCQHPVVILKDVRANVLNSLVHFMYHGAVDVPEDQLTDFLNTAQALEIKGLAEDDGPKSQIVRPDGPPLAKRLKQGNVNVQSSRVLPANVKDAPVISVERARSLVQSGAFSSPVELSENKSKSSPDFRDSYDESNLLSKFNSSEVSITPSRSSSSRSDTSNVPDTNDNNVRNDFHRMRVKEEDEYESDELEIVEAESLMNSIKSEAATTSADEQMFRERLSTAFPSNDDSSQPAGSFSLLEGAAAEWMRLKMIQTKDCVYCGKGFKQKTDLHRHVEAVHIEKPLDQWESCDICGKKFKTSHLRNMHYKRMHKMKLEYQMMKGQLAGTPLTTADDK